MLVDRGLEYIIGALAEMGYSARWGVWSSGDMGACHRRERLWLFAYSQVPSCTAVQCPAGGIREEWREWEPRGSGCGPLFGSNGQAAHTTQLQRDGGEVGHKWAKIGKTPSESGDGGSEGDWQRQFGLVSEPCLHRGDDGLADRVGRTKSIGNGQDPRVAATAFRILSQGIV